MVNEFRVIPVPAYNMQSRRLVHPTQYLDTLKGAVVIIRFTLKHWPISCEFTDTNVADIVSMRVLIPPRKPPRTPSRRVALMDPFDREELDWSPIKKSRTGVWSYLNNHLRIVIWTSLKNLVRCRPFWSTELRRPLSNLVLKNSDDCRICE